MNLFLHRCTDQTIHGKRNVGTHSWNEKLVKILFFRTKPFFTMVKIVATEKCFVKKCLHKRNCSSNSKHQSFISVILLLLTISFMVASYRSSLEVNAELITYGHNFRRNQIITVLKTLVLDNDAFRYFVAKGEYCLIEASFLFHALFGLSSIA